MQTAAIIEAHPATVERRQNERRQADKIIELKLKEFALVAARMLRMHQHQAAADDFIDKCQALIARTMRGER